MKLLTDFVDYYDELLSKCGSEDTETTYERKLSDSVSKVEDLKYLRSIGIETIDIRPVSKLIDSSKIVVYTNTKKHMGEGKQVVSTNDAYNMYFNHLGCEYYTGNENTCKMLQIGSKRFKLVIRNKGLVETEILEIEALNDDLHYTVDYPIYSIDYVNKLGNMIACDFNRVQKLKHLGLEKYIPPALIVNEINKFYTIKNQRSEA